MTTEAKPEQAAVTLPGDGTLVPLDAILAAIKEMDTPTLAAWWAYHSEPTRAVLDRAKDELVGRMLKAGQTLVPLDDGRELMLEQGVRRSCDAAAMAKVKEELFAKHRVEFGLVRTRTTHEPDMREVAKASKLGRDVELAIRACISEEPTSPRLKVKEKGGRP